MALTKKVYSVLKLSKFGLDRLTHSWSPLAYVFNAKPSTRINLKILSERSGLFRVPALVTEEGFYKLQDKCEEDAKMLIEEAISANRKRKMVDIFDELSDTLCKVADMSEFIRVAHPDPKYTQLAELACCTVSSIVEKLNTNYKLYSALKYVVESGDIMPTSAMDKHVAQLFLFDFEQSGIHLEEYERREVVVLNNTILHIGQNFAASSGNPRLAMKSSLPEHVQRLYHTDGNHIIMSNLYADAPNPAVREFAYRLFLLPESNQEVLLTQLLGARNKLAQLCGFKSYSERALKGSLAENPTTVMKFLNLLAEALYPRADNDFKVMLQCKQQEMNKNGNMLNMWDVPYFSNKIRRSAFEITGQEYSVYFPLGSIMEGLNKLLQSLFGISIQPVELANGESWHNNIYKIAFIHETEGLLGYVYCDFFTREGKQLQDCHFTIQGGKENSDGTYQLPVVAVMLNIPEPKWNNVPLLQPYMVDNLFHEMGHALHSMLARTKFQHVTGTRCCTDFAEVPSILMEYFASDPRVLKTFALHYKTGEPMPEAMLNRLCASKYLFVASEMQQQVFYSAIDQIYHGPFPLEGSLTSILATCQEKYYGVPHVPNTAWHLRFSHLVGYGAKYYAYLMSKAVASWIWQTHFEKDPFSRSSGDLYRFHCLNYGGGKPVKKLVGDFLNREVTMSALVESLVKETDEQYKTLEMYRQI